MGRLTLDSLEFARRHLERYYVSDFFPNPIELEAIWSQWDSIKAQLLAQDIADQYEPHGLTALVWSKHRGGYRVVHQLEALDCLVYIALAFMAAARIEQSRKPIEAGVACAYRIQIDDGSFFAAGNGFETFKERSKNLSAKYKFVLLSDIVDFYNQIYLHRLQNSIASTGNASAELATDVERFLSKLNLRNSQGIPVGPSPSIIFSESTLTDVDNFLADLGVEHTRYVDDFRIFSDSKQQLEEVQRELTLYLHKTHRLTLSSEKTKIVSSDEFVQTALENHYELEKAELILSLDEAGGDYVPAIGDIELDDISDDSPDELIPVENDSALQFEFHKSQVIAGFTSLCSRPTLDLGLARVLLRQSRLMKLPELVDISFEKHDLLKPVLNALVFYLSDVVRIYGRAEFADKLERWTENNLNLSQLERIWIEWLILNTHLYEDSLALKQFIARSPSIATQAQLAFREKNVAWVRRYKDEIFSLSPQSLRAVIFASRVLPEDERTPWLRQLRRSAVGITEKAMIEWALGWTDTPSADLFDDDMPF